MSLLPPCATFMCALYTLQYANVGPLSLWHINCKSVTHSGLYLAAYFFVFAELAQTSNQTLYNTWCTEHMGKQPIENAILTSENNIEKNCFGFTENPGDWFSFPGEQEIWWISRSLPANAGDLTCMHNSTVTTCETQQFIS